MFVNVICYLYPGVNKTGVAIVRIENGSVHTVAIGSTENEIVAPLLERVKPTEMVVATDRFYSENHTRVPMPSSVKRFTIARAGWEKRRVPLIIDGKRQHGVYMHNVYKMLFTDLMRRQVSIKGWNMVKFDKEWADSHAPAELGRVK